MEVEDQSEKSEMLGVEIRGIVERRYPCFDLVTMLKHFSGCGHIVALILVP